ncbi:MAG: ATP-binding protein [bacterium]|nr:ATP-binding protein [bacterium]
MSCLASDPGVHLMREAALLAAECTVRTPEDLLNTSDLDWNNEEAYAASASWKLIKQQVKSREQDLLSDDMTSLDYWLLCCVAASELYIEAAAAFSIIAEDERLYLPTPTSFARIAVACLDSGYQSAIQIAMGGGRLHLLGLIETVESSNVTRPLSHYGLRLIEKECSLLFTGIPSAYSNSMALEIEEIPQTIVFETEARAVMRLMAEKNSVWIRSTSRRTSRQFALDIAAVMKLDAAFSTPHEGVDIEPGSIARFPELLIIDLFGFSGTAPAWLWRARDMDCRFVVIAPSSIPYPGFHAIDAPAFSRQQAEKVWLSVRLSADDRSSLEQRFSLTILELRTALREAELIAAMTKSGNSSAKHVPDAAMIAQAVRSEGGRRMGHNVNLVTSEVTLDDLVAPAMIKRTLNDAVAWRRNTHQVFGRMGLRNDAAEGRGLSLLFSGPPGSGKTFAARGLASALGLNLYRIDLSQVVSKYIGETEKALAQIFDEAEAGHGMLFFDEADAVFGKRSEVKDAHDRYANIEVGYLLQRMETFDGVMALATNLRSNLDQAFLRRIRFLLEFPMPGLSARRALWQRNLPDTEWCAADLDIDLLSERFRLSGGNIRNAAVAAAHLAAEADTAVGSEQLTLALYRELQKSGLPRGVKDFGPLAQYLPTECQPRKT